MKKFMAGNILLALLLAAFFTPAIAAESGHEKHPEQGFYMTKRLEFGVGSVSAKLTGIGTAHLDDRKSIINPGSGVTLKVAFSNINEEAFKKCRPLLEAEVPEKMRLTVFGRGSYRLFLRHGIIHVVAYKLESVTACEIAPAPTPAPASEPVMTNPPDTRPMMPPGKP